MVVFRTLAAAGFLLLSAVFAGAQLIVEDFDDETTGAPPAWRWWNNGSSGTVQVDATTFLGPSGKSVALERTTFDGRGFGFGRNFPPLDGPAVLSYSFRVGSTTEETLTAVGGNNAGHQVAWWVAAGGPVGNAVGTYSDAGGWNHVMDISVDTWYGVTLEIYPSTHTYDITVWEEAVPANSAAETGIPFRNGSDVEVIDQIQFGNFSDAAGGPAAPAFVDDVDFVGSRVMVDGFESANTSAWPVSTRPRTVITQCGQIVTTDAILGADLSCPSGAPESAAVKAGASNITIDLGGHTITGHPDGFGVAVENLTGVTVQNGIIRNYAVGVFLWYAETAVVRDVMVEQVTETDPELNFRGVQGSFSQGVLIRDCFFKYLPLFHRAGVNLANSVFVIDNIEVNGGAVGSMIAGEISGTDATIINSRFIHTIHSAVLVYQTDNSTIADNEFLRSPINIEELTQGEITGITIEDNLIADWGTGIMFRGGSGSTIQGNLIRAHTSHGIFMDADMFCPPTPTPDCFYATDNLITGNVVTGNSIDLAHHPNALGNTWTDNTCLTKEGAEIPACIAP